MGGRVAVGVVGTVGAITAALAPTSAASSSTLALGPIVRIVTPQTSVCPFEGEPETARTRMGIWVAYNDDHQCLLNPTATRFEEVQLVRRQGPPEFIPLPTSSTGVAAGDPDLAPAADGGVYVATLWESSSQSHTGPVSIRIMQIDPHLRMQVLPTPSLHGKDGFDDKEFIASDTEQASPYFGHVYVAWDDTNTNEVVVRAWDGRRWEAPVRLGSLSGAVGGIAAPDVAVGPHGVMAVGMERQADGYSVVRISHDGGKRFSREIVAIKGLEPGYTDPSCPLRPTVGIRQRANVDTRVAFDRSGDLHVVASHGTVETVAGDEVHAPAVVEHALIHGVRVVHVEPVTPPTADEQWAPALAPAPSGGIAVSWLQTNGTARDTYDAWIAVEPAGADVFNPDQRLSPTASVFPAAMEAMANSNCYGLGDYIGMASTPEGVATVWPTTDADGSGVDSVILLRTATPSVTPKP